jgi:GGDEF domain-containing protein
MGRRVLSLLRRPVLDGVAEHHPVRASLGISVLLPHRLVAADFARPVAAEYFESMAQAIVLKADEALYRAKAKGGDGLHVGEETRWMPLEEGA